MSVIVGVYIIRNINSGDCYIGSSKNVNRRISEHNRLLSKGRHFSIKLQNDWNLMGALAFEYSIIERLGEFDNELLSKLEKKNVDLYAPAYNTHKKTKRQNIVLCGDKSVFYKHGLHKHPLYGVWVKIKNRCYNKKHKAYHNYGGIGITMCDDWKHNPQNFIKWALDNGWQKGLQIDKDIKSKGLSMSSKVYSPETCSVVTPKVNNLHKKTNRIIEYKGRSQTLTEWSVELGIDRRLLFSRLWRGITGDALFESKKELRILYEYNGVSKTIGEWANAYNLSPATLYRRVATQRLSIHDALHRPIDSNYERKKLPKTW